MKVKYFEGKATFVQRLKLTTKAYSAEGYLEYGACNDHSCLPPTQVPFKVKGSDGPASATLDKVETPAEVQGEELKPNAVNPVQSNSPSVSSQNTIDKSQWWTPVIKELRGFNGEDTASRSLWSVFLLGMLGGFIALLTPCVWPTIPLTVSFFMHRSSEKRKAVKWALLYGLSIIVIYVGLGLLITLWKGASALNAMSTNAVFNLFFFVLLLLFGISFLGGFELTLPSSWTVGTGRKARAASGLPGLFLMAFTLVLVSFSCTGPIIGFLLVELSNLSSILSPTVGMLGFAVALALPFSVFALFPEILKKLPRSGSWMNVLKVTLGFIEIAFALKFLSVADQAYGWHLLDRETFLVLWIVLSALLGVYLLGKIRFPLDEETPTTSVSRFFMALVTFAFALYMVPGLWGAPLKAISAFSPPLSTQDFNLYHQDVTAAYTDFEEGMTAAIQQHKPVLLDFTGKGCVNCRKMEGSVWQDPRVRQMLTDNYVLVSLYVDDKTPLEPQEITENGKLVYLRTNGDKWSYLQRHKFGANTQPFYVPLDNVGRPLNQAYSYNEDISAYLDFLKKGMERYR